jgi:hypothetical protein
MQKQRNRQQRNGGDELLHAAHVTFPMSRYPKPLDDDSQLEAVYKLGIPRLTAV